MNIDINLWHKNSSDTEKESLTNISRKAEPIENADEIVLQYLTQEADYELDRKRSFSTRAGIAITFLSTLLITFIKINRLPTLTEAAIQNISFVLLFALYVLVDILVVIALIWTLWGFIGIFNIKQLERIDVRDLNQTKGRQKDKTISGLCDTLKIIVEKNANKNEEIAAKFESTMERLKITIIILSFLFFLNILLVCLGVIQ